MNTQREFEIAFVGLKPGFHEYHYEVKDKFFEAYKEQEFSNSKATVQLTLEKSTNFMMLKFEIGGSVEVICDRCGNSLPMSLWDEFNVLVKLVENPEELNAQSEDPDIYYISRTESILNISEFIYEFINLSIPLQRMCPEDEVGGPQCNKEALAVLNKMKVENNQSTNPIWKDLDKFKNL